MASRAEEREPSALRAVFRWDSGAGGGTENARLENAGRSKMHGRKTRNWKTQHQTAGLVSAGRGMYGKPNGVLRM